MDDVCHHGRVACRLVQSLPLLQSTYYTVDDDDDDSHSLIAVTSRAELFETDRAHSDINDAMAG